MPDTLAARVRAKYPGTYDDLSDEQLEAKVIAKYPGVYDDVPRTKTASEAPGFARLQAPLDTGEVKKPTIFEQPAWQSIGDAAVGVTKEIGNAAMGLGNLGVMAARSDVPGLIQTLWNGVTGIPGAIVQAGQDIGSGEPERMGRGAVDTAMLVPSTATLGGAAADVGMQGAKAAGRAVMRHPARAADTAIALMTKRPMAAARGVMGQGPISSWVEALGGKTPEPMPSHALGLSPQQQLAQEIDWRTTDAVPIDAMSRKGIIEPGESRVGLGERAANLATQGASDAQLAEMMQLLKALRQRMHISEKAGRH